MIRASNVLDPCAGWGGRMLGVSCVADGYTCFEPSIRTANGLQRLAEFIAPFIGSFKAKVFNLAFEDALAFGRYDLALTSPPYFDTESYSSDPGDSATRYKTLEVWREKFFVPLIDRTMMQLRPGRPFILNIGDRKYPLSKFLREHCDGRYKVKKLKNYLSGKAGLGKDGTEGEQFYEITNP